MTQSLNIPDLALNGDPGLLFSFKTVRHFPPSIHSWQIAEFQYLNQTWTTLYIIKFQLSKFSELKDFLQIRHILRIHFW